MNIINTIMFWSLLTIGYQIGKHNRKSSNLNNLHYKKYEK